MEKVNEGWRRYTLTFDVNEDNDLELGFDESLRREIQEAVSGYESDGISNIKITLEDENCAVSTVKRDWLAMEKVLGISAADSRYAKPNSRPYQSKDSVYVAIMNLPVGTKVYLCDGWLAAVGSDEGVFVGSEEAEIAVDEDGYKVLRLPYGRYLNNVNHKGGLEFDGDEFPLIAANMHGEVEILRLGVAEK